MTCLLWTDGCRSGRYFTRPEKGKVASTRPAVTRYYSGVRAGHPDDGFPAHDFRREEPEGGVL